MNNAIKLGAIVINLFVLPFFVFAAPNIADVNGTISHGNSVIISGTEFGAKTTALPNLWDTVDNQSSYNSFSNGEILDYNHHVGFPYPYDNSGAVANTDTTYCNVSEEQRSSYSTACYKGINNHKNSVSREDHQDGGDQFYVAFWLKLESNIFGNESEKWFRGIHNTPDFSQRTFTWSQLNSGVYDTYDSCPGGACVTGKGSKPSANTWTFMELYFDNINYSYTLKMNNSAVDMNRSWAIDSADCRITKAWIIGRDAGGVLPSNITSWLDDIYLDNTFQHVVIGNAPTYLACNHLEIQPATAWSSNGQSITVILNQGSFSDGSIAYLYVVDSDGTANETGYPITLSGSSDAIAPTAPSGLAVS